MSCIRLCKVGVAVLFCWMSTPALEADAAFAKQFAERSRSVVYAEYTITQEEDRQEGRAVGTVLDDEGLVILPGGAIWDWIPQEQLGNFKVYLPGNPETEGYEAEYLGADTLNGWHYLRVEEAGRSGLIPVSKWGTAEVAVGEEIWGICLTGDELDYLAYYRYARMSASQRLPLWHGFATGDIAIPGAPVFNRAGKLAGWASTSFPVEREIWIQGDYFPAQMRNADESYVFVLAKDFMAEAGKGVPPQPEGGERPWLGIVGTQPIDKDTAAFLGLAGQGALVISEVLPESPAAVAGLENRDILVALDGERLPRFKPDGVIQGWFERKLLSKNPGDAVELTVVRGTAEKTVTAELATAPRRLRNAERAYIDALGFSVREFLVGDAIQRRVDHRELKGVVVAFIRQNSQPASAGMQLGDWILEIDGKPVQGMTDVQETLQAIATDKQRSEYVLLVRRGNETAVLRVKIN